MFPRACVHISFDLCIPLVPVFIISPNFLWCQNSTITTTPCFVLFCVLCCYVVATTFVSWKQTYCNWIWTHNPSCLRMHWRCNSRGGAEPRKDRSNKSFRVLHARTLCTPHQHICIATTAYVCETYRRGFFLAVIVVVACTLVPLPNYSIRHVVDNDMKTK